jgi:hypothetical protein
VATVKDFDHPALFLLFVTLGVVSVMALGSVVAQHFGWTGLLGLFKGGVAPVSGVAPPEG